ncbi:MAG: hypothetical protein JNL74_10855 [Fibrobacteres bacterium]|nr:hypothetical protein [Fibrobacterota bacterium]
MKKLNKKYLLILVAVLIAAYMLNNGSNDEWMPEPSTKKKKKSRELDYSQLRREAFAAISSDSIPIIPDTLHDPFKSVSRNNSTSSGAKSTIPRVVKRNIILKGFASRHPLQALVLDEKGISHIVKEGDLFNGITVISILENSITLKDAYGTFTVNQE